MVACSESSNASSQASSGVVSNVPGGRTAGVVDDDIEPTVGGYGALDRVAQSLAVSNVARDVRAHPGTDVGGRGKALGVAGQHGHRGALGGKCARDRKPHSRGRTADDRDRPVQSEFHRLDGYTIAVVHYRPIDASIMPRFSGPRTFMRLPHVQTTEDVDVVVIGIPTDDAVSFKSGARFGPEGIRSASALLRPYNPNLHVDVHEVLSIVDYGDAPTVPGYHEETLAPDRGVSARRCTTAGVTPLCLGGDHSMVLGELRAAAAVHGPLALVHLDAHADVWEQYYGVRYFHGTVFKRAVEEGLVDATAPRCRPVCAARSTARPTSRHRPTSATTRFRGSRWLSSLPLEYGDRVRARVGDRRAFLSFDIDFVDPAFAPGTGTPEVGGPTSAQAMAYLRALEGIDFRGFDCVEVAPAYDPAGITAWLAASACHEMLSLKALRVLAGRAGLTNAAPVD